MGLFNNRKKTQNEEEVINNSDVTEEMSEASEDASATYESEEEDSEEVAEHFDYEDDENEDEENAQSDEDRYFGELIDYFTNRDTEALNSVERKIISKEDFKQRVYDFAIRSFRGIDRDMLDRIMVRFEAFLWSYDILDELIDDESISDIKVHSYDNIRIKVYGKRKSLNLKFRDKTHFERFVNRVAVKNKVNISDQNAIQTFTDKESSPKFILRFNITTGFINSSGSYCLHIRKIPKQKYTLEQLKKAGMLTQKQADYLYDAAKNRGGLLFCGKGASGKTTLMNHLIDEIPFDMSGLIIQENEELFTDKHPDLMAQHIVTNRGEGKIEFTLQDLARNGLLTDIDYFIIGEIKGGEALYMLNAAYTGHKCWATVHGASSTEAIDKLADYIKYSSDYTKEEAEQMLVHLDTVIFLENFKVKEISEVVGWDDKAKRLVYRPVTFDDEDKEKRHKGG